MSKVLVTGGLGFIGSAVVRRLVQSGQTVRVLDARLAGHGANDANVADVRESIEIVDADVRELPDRLDLLKDVTGVVHAAAHVSHTAGLNDSFIDLEHNVRGTLALLDAVRRAVPRAPIVFTSTRGVYGIPDSLPVPESARVAPLGLHEWSKVAAEEAIRTFARLHGIRAGILRLTNVYGPGAQIRSHHFGVVNWWIGRAMANETIPVYGDGAVRRDLVFVDDAAAAIAQVLTTADSSMFDVVTLNVGSDKAMSLLEIANAIVGSVQSGRVELVPYSNDRKRMEVGDFRTDVTAIHKLLGWYPTTLLEDGLRNTVAFYRAHWDRFR